MSPIGRLEVRLQKPNVIFERWLQKWLQEAENTGSKSAQKLREALQSLQLYPLPLASGRECAILKGFHARLCKLIDEEMLKQQSKDQNEITNCENVYERDLQQLVASTTKMKTKSKCNKPKVRKPSKKALKAIEEENDHLRNVVMCPGLFRIVLAVDCQETSGKNKKTLDNTRAYLESLDVEYEVRRLTVGDFLWIAKDKEGNELVLPYIVERKRMDDLASSIRDGRFHEQKHRLKHTCIPNIIYLIEDYNDNYLGVPVDNLKQALSNTLVHNQFSVVHTENHRRSISYLKGMTQMLIKIFKDKCLMSVNTENMSDSLYINHSVQKLIKFKSLYDNSSRNAHLTIGEVFVQQLLQLHSLSLEKCLAIIAAYPTPFHLIQAYKQCNTTQEAENLLSNMRYGETQRPIGHKISEILYNFYRKEF